jgi:hypothetical protein
LERIESNGEPEATKAAVSADQESADFAKEAGDSIFYGTPDGSKFRIAFDALFAQPSLIVYDGFEMSAKRNFKNLTAYVVQTYNELFLGPKGKFDDEMTIPMLRILDAQSKVMITADMPIKDFIALMDAAMDSADGLLIKRIGDHVEKNYALDLNGITSDSMSKSHAVNDELMIRDDHAKTLLKIAYLYRVFIPLISQYFLYDKAMFSKAASDENGVIQDGYEFDDVNRILFSHLFDIFAGDGDALRNKLYKLTYSRVIKTAFSAKKYWAKAKNVGITKETVTLDIYDKLQTNAVAKLIMDPNLNIVSFLQSVINNQLMFLMQNKFRDRYIIIDAKDDDSPGSTSDDDDDDQTEFERIEIDTARKDEGQKIIRDINIAQTLKNLPDSMNVSITQPEIEYAVKTKLPHVNSIQETIVGLLMDRYFDDVDAIKRLNSEQYAQVLVCCCKYLQQRKFSLLPKIMVCHCERIRDKLGVTAKSDFESSKLYKELFSSKYGCFVDDAEYPMESLVSQIYASVFKDESGKYVMDGSYKIGDVAEELVKLALLI